MCGLRAYKKACLAIDLVAGAVLCTLLVPQEVDLEQVYFTLHEEKEGV